MHGPIVTSDLDEDLPRQSQLKTNMGQALIQIAGTYPTVLEAVLEAYQNALDSNATRVEIKLDKDRRRVFIRDNGDGVSRENFDKALASVGVSVKRSGKLGRFGRGLISPLNKSEYFTFTSCPKGSSEYIKWTFNREKIGEQRDEVFIPWEPVKNLKFSAKADRSASSGQVSWRTQVSIANYSKDKMIGRITNIEDIIGAIIVRYGAVMRETDIRFDVLLIDGGKTYVKRDVMAQPYSGDRLDPVDIVHENAGKVEFRLYLTRKSSLDTKGVVNVGEAGHNTQFPISDMRRRLLPFISEEAIDALCSGVFEGEILGQHIRMNPDRKGFVEDEAYLGFLVAIEEWYTLYGHKFVEAAKSASQEERYRELGERSLQSLRDLLKDDRFKDVCEKLRGMGLLMPDKKGDQKNPKRGADEIGEAEVSPGGGGGKNTATTPQPKPKPVPRDPKPKIAKDASVSRSRNFGLQFCHAPLENSNRLWEHDIEEGILYINIRHYTWVECASSGSDRRVMQLQESIALMALTLLTVPDDWYEQTRLFAEELADMSAILLTSSHAFTGGRPPKKAE